ncbi:MAG: hypothetical protein EZS28_008816 [Streblomastix strix]|uniref:Uncharacterized protein n=1 Tax=Streblomastix strix TaxID=222440 RepID=A0A5J4WKY5_9EUKA|nr:MAG: hypothetical protein EZS28_008816 [Streblomastix strix]
MNEDDQGVPNKDNGQLNGSDGIYNIDGDYQASAIGSSEQSVQNIDDVIIQSGYPTVSGVDSISAQRRQNLAAFGRNTALMERVKSCVASIGGRQREVKFGRTDPKRIGEEAIVLTYGSQL